MKKITLLLALVCSMSLFATRYLVQTGAPGAAAWRAAGAGEVLVDLTVNAQSLNAWLSASFPTSFPSGDEVWLVAGTYNVAAVYGYQANFKIYGGFSGSENSLSERVNGVNPWDFVNGTVIDGGESTKIFTAAGPRLAVFDGLTMTNAKVTGASGGALEARDGVTINACKFINNSTNGNGGAVILNGGGVISNSYFSGNSGNSGGAVHVGGGTGITSSITNCFFENNAVYGYANNLGGALRSQFAGTLTVSNCIFRNNSAAGSGSAIHIQLAAATNFTTVSNSLIYGNTGKGAFYMLGGTLNNVTVVNNVEGGVYVASASIPSKIYNSVFWGTGNSGAITSVVNNAVAIVQNTASLSFQTNFTGTNNINNVLLNASNSGSELGVYYPEFIDPETNNWELGYKSALLNTGQTIALVTTDFNGVARPQGSAYDIGAHELQYFNTTVTFNSGGTVNALTSGDILTEPKGKPLVFTITPSGGQVIASVKYNDVEVKEELVEGVYNAPALSANATLEVEFSTTTSVNEINKSFACFTSGNMVQLSGITTGDEVSLYSISGARLFNMIAVSTEMSVPVSRGIYLVKVADKVKKVVVN